jgi:hypothetical protein
MYGSNRLKWFSWNFHELIDALATALSLQGVFIPILKKNRN